MKTEVTGRRETGRLGSDRLFEDEICVGGGGGRESEWSALGGRRMVMRKGIWRRNSGCLARSGYAGSDFWGGGMRRALVA